MSVEVVESELGLNVGFGTSQQLISLEDGFSICKYNFVGNISKLFLKTRTFLCFCDREAKNALTEMSSVSSVSFAP